MEPWIARVEAAVARILEAAGLDETILARTVAHAGVAFYLGANLLTRLSGAAAVDEILAASSNAALLVESLVPPAQDS
jgi:hypothetical protein